MAYIATSYLTIDVDFWLDPTNPMLTSLFSVLHWAMCHPEILVVTHHQQILKHANTHPADRLVNVDAHSDVCHWKPGEKMGPFNCGTWGAFIEWRQAAVFHWIHPHTNGGIDKGNCNSSFHWDEKLDWKKTTSKKVCPSRLTVDYLVKLGPYTGVSISLSPEWSSLPCVELAKLIARYDERSIKRSHWKNGDTPVIRRKP